MVFTLNKSGRGCYELLSTLIIMPKRYNSRTCVYESSRNKIIVNQILKNDMKN